MKINTYIQEIKSLKQQYNSENVSLIIGSGFSKNALSDFPDWNELLRDMVEELYPNHFSNITKVITNNKGNIQIEEDPEFRRNCLQKIINEVGYLEVVSQFLKKRGMREAVETYIEDRTPYADANTFVIPNKNITIDIKDTDLLLHEKVLEGKWEQIYTTNYDNLLEYTAKIKHKDWKSITDGYNLSFTDTKKNIIKLHGSLRSKEDRENNEMFYFDGCHDHCYIITKEDYENYPSQHEAFTQLMRISLLRGVFCLIGFSGNDPNFLSWIKWVKDILVKNKNGKNYTEKIKVYVITINDKEISKESQLYYKNHHICIIPLKNNDVINEINCKSDIPKDLLKSFFDYLYVSNNNEILYNSLWQAAKNKVSSVDEKEMLELSLKIGFKGRFIFQQSFLLDLIYPKKEISIWDVNLAILALFDMRSDRDYADLDVIISSKFNQLSLEFQNLYYNVKNRQNTLNDSSTEVLKLENNEDVDAIFYEKILRHSFNLEFDQIEQLLKEWNPQNIYIINKAGMLAQFDKTTAKNILIEYLDINNNESEDNKYLIIQTLNILLDYNERKYNITNFKNQKLKSLYDKADLLVKETLKKDNIKPYGKAQTTFQNIKYEECLRVLNFLIDVTPNNINYIINSSKWYDIFKQLYIINPLPCFYFSLQFDSEDLLIRIGQDYAYSDSLQEKTEFLLLKSLDNIITNKLPNTLHKSTFLICSQMLSGVKSLKWERKFLKIWEHYLENDFDKDMSFFDYRFRFITSGLSKLKTNAIKQQIMLDCINNRSRNYDSSIDFLYYLAPLNIKIDPKFQSIISDFTKNISDPKEINIAGNIYKHLTPESLSEVSDKINGFLVSNTINFDNLYASAYFLKVSKKPTDSLKMHLIKSEKLWDNGINEKSASEPNFLTFSKFSKDINWKISEVHEIYFQLTKSLEQLLNSYFYNNDDGLMKSSYIKLLEEMLSFLLENEKHLSHKEDYIEIIENIQKQLEYKREFSNIEEGLLSDDVYKLVTALNMLDNKMKRVDNDKTIINELLILTTRILHKRKVGLINCLNYIDYFLQKYFKSKKIPINLLESVLLFVSQYHINEMLKLDIDIAQASKYLVSISKSLKKNGKNSPSIEYWLNINKTRRFN